MPSRMMYRSLIKWIIRIPQSKLWERLKSKHLTRRTSVLPIYLEDLGFHESSLTTVLLLVWASFSFYGKKLSWSNSVRFLCIQSDDQDSSNGYSHRTVSGNLHVFLACHFYASVLVTNEQCRSIPRYYPPCLSVGFSVPSMILQTEDHRRFNTVITLFVLHNNVLGSGQFHCKNLYTT